jgi:SAM-dependent methyltransferase
MPKASWRDRYLDRFYRGRPGWTDGTTEFWRLCKAWIAPGARILEIGSGPTNRTTEFLATIGDVTGADVDPGVRANAHLAQVKLIRDGRLPIPDAAFDACVSNYVLEHVSDAALHLSEVARVLRPGGCYVFRTPNRWHYVALVARATPHWFHELVANRLRKLPESAHDPYPTVYALNSRRILQRYAREAGLVVRELRAVEKEPSYGMISPVAFLALMAYERLVNSTGALAGLRANLFGVAQKPPAEATS